MVARGGMFSLSLSLAWVQGVVEVKYLARAAAKLQGLSTDAPWSTVRRLWWLLGSPTSRTRGTTWNSGMGSQRTWWLHVFLDCSSMLRSKIAQQLVLSLEINVETKFPLRRD